MKRHVYCAEYVYQLLKAYSSYRQNLLSSLKNPYSISEFIHFPLSPLSLFPSIIPGFF